MQKLSSSGLRNPAAVSDGTDTLDAELLPYVERYYRSWDADPVTPHHIVNGL